MWEVLKFGGSSLKGNGMKQITSIIKNNNSKKVIVLSAVGGITDLLYKLSEGFDNTIYELLLVVYFDLLTLLKIDDSKEILQKLEDLKKETDKDIIVSYGEELSVLIFSKYLEKLKIKHKNIDVKNLIIYNKDNNNYSFDLNYFVSNSNNYDLIITQGFITGTTDGGIHLLSRSGSDTSATMLANMLSSKDVYIYTDVNGIYATDPNKIKNNNIIQNIDYNTAQELSAMGAKVMHPFSIKPAQEKNINIHIKNTFNYNRPGTTISKQESNNIAITNLSNITLFHIKSLNMWNNYGFVNDIFDDFSKNNIDINIITTSQFVISCTTDETDKDKLNSIYQELSKRYEVEVIYNCNMISVVGNNIYEKSAEIFELTKNYNIFITHISSNKLSISFIVNNDIELTLHEKLFYLFYQKYRWWENEIDIIKNTFKFHSENSLYFYSRNDIEKNCDNLKNKLKFVDNFYYAMKANSNIMVLKYITNKEFGLECVSQNEIKLALKYTKDIIFTPNFCDVNEYKFAFNKNCKVIVDNYEILSNDIFKNKSIALRIDPIYGDGHHKKVVTAGEDCKFGIDISDISKVVEICNKNNIKVIGLHCHKGSGINNPKLWTDNAIFLLSFLDKFKDLEFINLGGGLGLELNLEEVNKYFTNNIKLKNIKIFIEPGRYLVANSGVLVSKVSQVKTKNKTNYIGLNTGMNSLIRPTLYNAYHPIFNINNLEGKEKYKYNVVGPICESGDIFGKNIELPVTNVNDLILIDTSGAYGFTMASQYNLRIPAREIII
jgi:bifunctional diaminopimelate decarboxylase / aspartate kinase